MLAVIGLCVACAIGFVIQMIYEKRNVNDYNRIFKQSRILWIGGKGEKGRY